MLVSVILPGSGADTDPAGALAQDRALLAAARGRVDGVTLAHGGPRDLTVAAFLAADADGADLRATVRGLPLGVLNPIELAEQLATVDHAWGGAFDAGVVVGDPSEFAAHDIDPARGPARFAEGLDLIRRMWMVQPMSGPGPQLRFGEIQPTLRPRHAGGPPLALDAATGTDLVLAARLGLGVHLGRPAGIDAAGRLLAAWRAFDTSLPASLELDAELATPDVLSTLDGAGADRVDVALPTGADPRDSLEALAAARTGATR